MESVKRSALREHHTEIVRDLEPRDVLPQLCQDGVLTENDAELISDGATRRQRCQMLLALLPTRGPAAYGSFTHALAQDGYAHLSDALHAALQHDTAAPPCGEETEHTAVHKCAQSSALCERCLGDLPSTWADPELQQLVQKHCCLLLDNVEPRDITDYPYQERVLSAEDCELIHGGATRRQRCTSLLTVLASKPAACAPAAALLCALATKYAFIVERCAPRISPDTTKSIVAEEADSSRPLSPGQNPGVFKQKPEPQRLVDVKDDVPDKQKQTEAHKNGIVPTEVPVTSEDFTAAKEKLCDTDPRSAEGHEGPVVWEPGNEVETVAVYKTPANVSSPQRLANRQLVVTFNYMSSLINQGQFDQFQTLSRKLGQKFATDADMQCLLCYLQTSRDLYGNNYDAAKKSINNAMEIVPATSNPKYFTVEIFTAKTRMYVSQKKLSKLEDTLTDVKQVIESDPVGCSGRAAGWLYMNDGRNCTAQLALLNPTVPRSRALYERLFNQAKQSFLRALNNFERDGGKDGPFGVGYAVCRLAILLLRCGDNGLTMDALVPPEEDVRVAGGYLRRLEDSDIPINRILSLHLLLARADHQFRRQNLVRAAEYASAALQVAEEMNLQEFIEHAHNRVVRLRMGGRKGVAGATPTHDEAEEAEFCRLLESTQESSDESSE